VQPGEGNEASNWIHLEDIVGAITFAQAQQLQGIYNLGNDEPLTRRVLLDRLCQHQGWNPAHWDASQLSQRAINVRLSNQKLKEAGYRFQHPTIVDL
jgi:NAD dependent epimerase/dehydratase family enzyme